MEINQQDFTIPFPSKTKIDEAFTQAGRVSAIVLGLGWGCNKDTNPAHRCARGQHYLAKLLFASQTILGVVFLFPFSYFLGRIHCGWPVVQLKIGRPKISVNALIEFLLNGRRNCVCGNGILIVKKRDFLIRDPNLKQRKKNYFINTF